MHRRDACATKDFLTVKLELESILSLNLLKGGLKMATWNLQLLKFGENYEEELIGPGPRAYIALTHPSDTIKKKVGKNEIEFKTISPDCATFGELEIEVNRLIKELETIKRQGKKFFEKEREKRKEYSEKTKLD